MGNGKIKALALSTAQSLEKGQRSGYRHSDIRAFDFRHGRNKGFGDSLHLWLQQGSNIGAHGAILIETTTGTTHRLTHLSDISSRFRSSTLQRVFKNLLSFSSLQKLLLPCWSQVWPLCTTGLGKWRVRMDHCGNSHLLVEAQRGRNQGFIRLNGGCILHTAAVNNGAPFLC